MWELKHFFLSHLNLLFSILYKHNFHSIIKCMLLKYLANLKYTRILWYIYWYYHVLLRTKKQEQTTKIQLSLNLLVRIFLNTKCLSKLKDI